MCNTIAIVGVAGLSINLMVCVVYHLDVSISGIKTISSGLVETGMLDRATITD
jgi:hypothetical protein